MASPGGSAEPCGLGRDADILRERDRIVGELANEVIQRIFAIGLDLQSTASVAAEPFLRRRIDRGIDGLDQVIRIIRDMVFGLQDGLSDRGLRAGILHLCEQLSPVPDVAFRGPVDGALDPAAAAELLDILGDALVVLDQRWTPVRIDVAAVDGAHVTMVQAVPIADITGAGERDGEFTGLRDRAAECGMRIEIESGPELVQISWYAT